MDDSESVEIPVIYKGEQLHFKAWLMVLGYTHKFKVIVNEREVFFEPDDEGSYRAIAATTETTDKDIDTGLLKAIVEAIQSLVK